MQHRHDHIDDHNSSALLLNSAAIPANAGMHSISGSGAFSSNPLEFKHDSVACLLRKPIVSHAHKPHMK